MRCDKGPAATPTSTPVFGAAAPNRIAYPAQPREHRATNVGMLMRPSLLNPLFAAGYDAPRRRLSAREALPSAVRPRGGGACRRSPVSPAHRRDRPPGAAETARRGARHRRHRRGHRRSTPAAAAAPAARALSDLYQRRDRRSHSDLFQCAQGLPAEAVAGRASGDTYRARSPSTTTCGRWCTPTASSRRSIWRSCRWSSRYMPLTEGLSLNQVRKAADAALARVPDLARMAGAELGCARALSGLRRGAACSAPAGGTRRSAAGRIGLVAAGLRRVPGGTAGARAGARPSAAPRRPRYRWHRAHPEKADRDAALLAHATRRRAPSARLSPIWPSPSACCGCSRATWDRARPWWPCLPPRP